MELRMMIPQCSTFTIWAEINQQLAAHAERVTEVVYGIPVALAEIRSGDLCGAGSSGAKDSCE